MKLANEYDSDEYGIIMRTNAKEAEDNVLHAELQFLIQEYRNILSAGRTRVCFSCLKKAPPEYLTDLKNIQQDGLTEIIIEDEELFCEAQGYLKQYQPEDLSKLRLYRDKMLPLHKLYSIEKAMENALKEHVWLKSGAYIVIQPTEALTVVDVNTGKCIDKKRDDKAYLTINKEAAKEIARQIRLRNLSGIILIDFINMSKTEFSEELLSYLEQQFKKDPIATTLVDVTKLQLVEVTRKKIRKPFHEAMDLHNGGNNK